MQNNVTLFRNITLAATLASTVMLFGCQKHDDVSEQDAAAANADRSAQAAQAATDAATAAIPAEPASAPASTATSATSATLPTDIKTAS